MPATTREAADDLLALAKLKRAAAEPNTQHNEPNVERARRPGPWVDGGFDRRHDSPNPTTK